MHAVFVTVNIAAAQFEQSQKSLHDQVVPRVKQAPGVINGYWIVRADHAQGASMVVFDTREHADAMVNMVRQQPLPPGVTLSSVEVREVVAHL